VLTRDRGRQPAQVVVWVVLMMPFFLAIAGLMIDSGQLFDARREAQNIADGAARVAAMQIDFDYLRTSGNFRFDSGMHDTTVRYIKGQEHGSGWRDAVITPDASGVRVTLSRDVPTTFIRIVKPDAHVTISATARAEPCVGIVGGKTITGATC
jgi:uncharacterized membrane protein